MLTSIKTRLEPTNQQFLQEEVERELCILKGGKSLGIDNIQAELLKQDGDETAKAVTTLWQRI